MSPDSPGIRAAIRLATPADAPLLAVLGASLFEQAFGPANTPEDMRAFLAESFSESLQRAELADADRRTWIAEDAGGTPVGYAMLRKGKRADGVVFAEPLEIQRLYVDRSWHGHGVGRALMDACLDDARARRSDGVWLSVWSLNPRAIAFYERMGFQAVGTATFVVGRDAQNDFIMAKALAPIAPIA